MESDGVSKLKTSKKGKYVELIKNSIQVIQPSAVPGIILRSFSTNISCVQYSSMVVNYHPYMDDLEGTLVINLYDTRHEDPAKALLYHTAFPVSKDQKIIFKLNRVMGPDEKKDVLAIEIKNIGVLAKEGTNFGKIKVKPSWNIAKKGLTGSLGTCITMPPLAVIRGTDIAPSRIGSITKGMEYIGSDTI
ncbi:TPA_asm: P3 [Nitraria betacytorhabdovirus 1]|nr:TPA_asm: P3 [Nitraria betacytorhabdovirus 1]